MKLSNCVLLFCAIISLSFIRCVEKPQDIDPPKQEEKDKEKEKDKEEEKEEDPSDNSADGEVLPEFGYLKSAVKVGNGNIYIGNKYDESRDLQIHFKKSMFNELMTFYSIGLIENITDQPIQVFSGVYSTVINRATSDNIGPLSIGTYGTWVGGNHSYQEGGKLKTAYTQSYVCYADGKELKDGDELFADKIRIVVVNKIYDPSKKSTINGEVVGFSGTMCTETVEYLIQSGNIEVTLKHDWENTSPVLITTYYGMQSMANGKYVFFPRGHTSDFIVKSNEISQNKSNYPKFNRYIQKADKNEWYESCYLTSDDIGNHANIRNEDFIYLISYGKVYHRQLSNYQVTNGSSYFWRGVYSYFKPLVDDNKLLSYTIRDSKGTILIVDVKTKGEHFIDLKKFNLSSISVQDIDQGITVFYDQVNKGLVVNAGLTGSGYIRLLD